jgi:large subunit ribosomal protein L17
VKLGQRQGDGAEVAILELVDYNTGQEKAAPKPKAKAAVGRKRGPKGKPETPKKANETPETAEAADTTAPAEPEAKGSDSK